MQRRAIFIDRDGTINVEKNYLFKFEDWEWIPGAVDAIRMFNEAGFLVIVISNQAGVARGYYGADDIEKLHASVTRVLESQNVKVDGYYYCPHHPEFGDNRECDCRKPAPGMILEAQRDWDIDLAHSYMIGDKASDIEVALAAGVHPVMVATGYGSAERHSIDSRVPYVADLLAAANFILRGERSIQSA